MFVSRVQAFCAGIRPRRAHSARSASEERGQSIIMVVMLIPVMLGIIGLVIDLGIYAGQRSSAQGAADAAALAAALDIRDGATVEQATATALDYAALNGYDSVDEGTVVTTNIPPTSGPNAGNPNYVEVIVETQPVTFFIQAITTDLDTVQVRAVAVVTTSDLPYALLTLNDTDCRSLDVSGSGDIIVNNGGIMIDSSCSAQAFRKTGSASVVASIIDIVGGYNGPASTCPPPSPLPADTVCPSPRTGRPYEADPLAGLTPPNLSTLGISPDSGGTPANPQPQHISNGDYVFNPGVYYGGIKLTTSGDITFLPGIYVMAGGGLDISSSGTVNGNGVLFYNTFDPQSPNSARGRCNEAHISGSTNSGSALTGPSSGPYEDIIFWQDDACVDNAGRGIRFHHSGSGTLETTGIFYMPTGWMHVTGSGYLGTVQIIVDHFDKSGSSDVIIDATNFVDIGPEGVELAE